VLAITIAATVLNGAGDERHTNRLIHEKSPYLLQHAHNPVDWYPWGREAFDKAKKEQKPIFLSVGYSTCHWCHVMERESFENPEIAKLMNNNFVSIKVDREERPDIDQVYMTFVQATTRSGGWPMTVFLTPDLKPFFGRNLFSARRQVGAAKPDESAEQNRRSVEIGPRTHHGQLGQTHQPITECGHRLRRFRKSE
jgi:uncharacterized protein YyaL (SSP411 family)